MEQYSRFTLARHPKKHTQSEATTMTNCQVKRFPGIQMGEEEDEGEEESVQELKKLLQYNEIDILTLTRQFV